MFLIEKFHFEKYIAMAEGGDFTHEQFDSMMKDMQH